MCESRIVKLSGTPSSVYEHEFGEEPQGERSVSYQHEGWDTPLLRDMAYGMCGTVTCIGGTYHLVEPR